MSQGELTKEWEIVTVEPKRLYSGLWGYAEGDISRSYSADTFVEKKRLRSLFKHAHNLYAAMNVNSGLTSGEAKAYPVLHESYATEIMDDYSASGLRDHYTGKHVKYLGNDCILGLPVIFRQRALKKAEMIDLIRRMYAYGGLFAAEAETYLNLLTDWYQKYEGHSLRNVLLSEMGKEDLPQSQAEMREFIEWMSTQTPTTDAQLTLF